MEQKNRQSMMFREGLARLCGWLQLLNDSLAHVDKTPDQIQAAFHSEEIDLDICGTVTGLQRAFEDVKENRETFKQVLLRIITVRAMDPNANMYGMVNGLSTAIIQATIDTNSVNGFDSTILPETAESGEMREMAELIGNIGKAETNGDAFVLLSKYRLDVRKRAITECAARRAEELERQRVQMSLNQPLDEKMRNLFQEQQLRRMRERSGGQQIPMADKITIEDAKGNVLMSSTTITGGGNNDQDNDGA